VSRSGRALTRKACCCPLFLDNTSPGSCLRVPLNQSPAKTVVAPQTPSAPPIHKAPVAVVAVVTSPRIRTIPPPVTHFKTHKCYHVVLLFGVTQRYWLPPPVPLSSVRVVGLGGAMVTRRGCGRWPRYGGNRGRYSLQRCAWKTLEGEANTAATWESQHAIQTKGRHARFLPSVQFVLLITCLFFSHRLL